MSGVEVTQADREAASNWIQACRLDMWALADDIRSGNADDYPTVQAFARHAVQAREEGARMMREAAESLIANGRFLTDSSPPKLFANQVVPLIHNLDPAEIVKGKA